MGITLAETAWPSASTVLKLKAHDDALLDEAQVGELARRLEQERLKLSDRTEELEQQMALKDDCSLGDAIEAASLQEDRARAAGLVQQNRKVIAEIDAALARLATGQYGVCEVSGEPIAYERLMLVPWARSGAGNPG